MRNHSPFTFEEISHINISAADFIDKQLTRVGVNNELGPFLRMSCPKEWEQRPLTEWQTGTPLFRSVIFAFWVLPIDVHFTVTPAGVKNLIYTPDFKLADLLIDGKHYKAILKSAQFHPVTDQLLHIDFLRLIDKTPIKVEVPLRFKGVSPDVKVGGKLIQQLRKIKIKTTPEFLVDELKADISKLDLGQALRVREVIVPKGVEIINNSATPVALIEIPRALKAAAAAEAKAEQKGAKKKK